MGNVFKILIYMKLNVKSYILYTTFNKYNNCILLLKNSYNIH